MNDIKDERPVVMFTLGNEEFGVNINNVKEIIRYQKITHMPNTPDYISGVINVRDQLIIVIDLAKKLNIKRKDISKSTRIIFLDFQDVNVGMIVDSASEVQRLVPNQIKPAPSIITGKIQAEYIEGVAILEENRLLILLDLLKILEVDEVHEIQNAVKSLTQNEPEESKKDQPILKDVDPNFHFRTHDGKQIKNVHELLQYINGLDEEAFKVYVNEEKNDFYMWIKNSVGDEELACNIKDIKNKNDISTSLVRRLLSIKE
ncbi:chemotaxis protein CheW [Candidatus Woesearchaeota archaeon]|nr:chemotaxis protein CheW [Candidatus Woesearchaeota archaeon]